MPIVSCVRGGKYLTWKEVWRMDFNPIGMGGLGDLSQRIECACMVNGKGCGPITHLYPCWCSSGGIGSGTL
jgi:hypothetical protein